MEEEPGLVNVLLLFGGGCDGHCAFIWARPFKADVERYSVGPNVSEESLCLCPPLEVGIVLSFEELLLLENSTLVHIIDVGDNFEGVTTWYVQFYHCVLSLVELDHVGLDVHVWMVAPKKL